jgi:hypothetical protein
MPVVTPSVLHAWMPGATHQESDHHHSELRWQAVPVCCQRHGQLMKMLMRLNRSSQLISSSAPGVAADS